MSAQPKARTWVVSPMYLPRGKAPYWTVMCSTGAGVVWLREKNGDVRQFASDEAAIAAATALNSGSAS